MKSKLLYVPYLKLITFYFVVGIISRFVLFFHPVTSGFFSVIDFLKIFGIGLFNDTLVFTIAYALFWMYLVFLSEKKFKKPWGGIILAILLLLTAYVLFFNTVFTEYGGGVSRIVSIFLILKTGCFALLLLFPYIRKSFRFYMISFVYFLFIFLMLFNVIAEYLFWDEFGCRYNFIAVDYLIYTNEVVGNIMESYPIIPMMSVLFLVAASITYFMVRNSRNILDKLPTFKEKIFSTLIYVFLIGCSIVGLIASEKWETSGNVFVNELQSNGLSKFYSAFNNNKLDYNKLYAKIPEKEAFAIINRQYSSRGNDIARVMKDSVPEVKKNVILISIESMSGEYMAHLGNKNNLTPNLDKMADEGIFFDNLYATGNRTVRGLEALTLCIPPIQGESVIKEKDNSNYYSTGSIFKSKGYTVQFMYGGWSYFDNMKSFFSGNGYSIVDRSSFDQKEITFSNVWGVCDEDMYNKALKVFNKDALSGKPFFAHIMTVSNHRPFTYPEGKVDISPKKKSRDGGVKYTDYAIGKFMEEAKKQPWFRNTVFIFVADHCASSAGKTSIPVDKYHIPAIIYSPAFLQPQRVSTRVSQIDLMPTLFGLLHFSYESHFYGQNIFNSDFKSRAFLATYQQLAYYKGNSLTVLSPKQKIEQFAVDKNGNEHKLDQSLETDKKEAIANYQTMNILIKDKKLKHK